MHQYRCAVVILFLLLLISSSAPCQDDFNSENTVYTVEDGREFIQYWTNYNESLIDNIESIFPHHDNSLSIVSSDTMACISAKGNLIDYSRFEWNDLADFDAQGNLLVLHMGYQKNDRYKKVCTYDRNGHLLRKVDTPGFSYFSYRDTRFAAKPDGGFFLMNAGDIDPHYTDDDDDDILDLYNYDPQGNLINILHMDDLFYHMKDPVHDLLVSEEGDFYFFGYSGHICKVSADGTFQYRFNLKRVREYAYYRNPIHWDNQGNIAILAPTSDGIEIYSRDGKLLKVISLTKNGKLQHTSFFAFRENGDLFASGEDGIAQYSHNGSFIRTIFPQQPEAWATAHPLKGKYPDLGHSWYIGDDGCFYISSESGNRIQKYSFKGKLLETTELEKSGVQIKRFEINSKGDILVQPSRDLLYVFDKKGKFIRARGPWSLDNFSFTLGPNDEIFMIDGCRLKRYNSDLTLLETYFLDDENEEHLSEGKAIQLASDDNLYILDSDSSIFVYTLRGKFLERFKLPVETSSFYLTDADNIVISGTVYDRRAENVLFQCFALDGRVFIHENRAYKFKKYFPSRIISVSTTRLISSGPTHSIQVKFNLDTSYNYPNGYIFLEGRTSDGTDFYSIACPAGEMKTVTFTDIPKGSTYKIWTSASRPDLMQLSPPLIRGRIAGADKLHTFKEKFAPLEYVKIRGGVFNKVGHPISGVRISFGKQFTITDMLGNYTLFVPPYSQGILKANKKGKFFERSTYSLNLNTNDRFYLNFFEKK